MLYTNFFASKHYNDIQFDLYSIVSDEIELSLSKIAVNNTIERQLQQLIVFYDDNLKKNIVNSELLYNSIENIFLESILIGSTSLDSFEFHKNLFNFMLVKPFPATTVVREEVIINISLIEQAVNTFSLMNALINLSAATFTSSDQIELLLSSISDQFSLVLNNNKYKKLSGAIIDFYDISTNISNMFAATIEFLKLSEVSLPKEQIVTVIRNSLSPFVYRYYGNLNFKKEIAKINQIQNPLDIQGEIKVLAT